MRILPPLTAALAAALLASAGIVLAQLEPGSLGGIARATAVERERANEKQDAADPDDESDFSSDSVAVDEPCAERHALERAPASAGPESRARPPVAGTERWHRE